MVGTQSGSVQPASGPYAEGCQNGNEADDEARIASYRDDNKTSTPKSLYPGDAMVFSDQARHLSS
jgi:hypothetical protein